MAKELMEIGGFITEGAEIVNHDNTLSGNGTVDSPLCVVPGYNETVLYSNLTDRPSSPGQSITLSETPLNFDYIGIYLNGSTPTGTTNVANGYEEVPFEQISSSNTLQFIKGFCGSLGSDNAVFEMGCGYSGTSSTTWTKWYGYAKNVASNEAAFNNPSHLNIWKVVGINRKQ